MNFAMRSGKRSLDMVLSAPIKISINPVSFFRSHAKILCCSHVIGYLEASTIHDDVAILSITGTAASVRGLPDLTAPSRLLWANQQPWSDGGTRRADRADNDVDEQNSDVPTDIKSRSARRAERVNRRMRRAAGGSRGHSKNLDKTPASNEFPTISPASARQLADYNSRDSDLKQPVPVLRARRAKPCSFCHVPYHHRIAPFSNMKLVPCLLCGKKWVPEILLATVEPPDSLPIRGSGVFVQVSQVKVPAVSTSGALWAHSSALAHIIALGIQARVCRSRPKSTGESDALAVSEALPFLEYELARQLMLKLKVIGRNAGVFGV